MCGTRADVTEAALGVGEAGPRRPAPAKEAVDTPDKKGSVDHVGDTDHHEITFKTWNAAAFDPTRSFSQTAGYASGHLEITIGTGADATSVSGDFDDALIVLADDPAAPPKN